MPLDPKAEEVRDWLRKALKDLTAGKHDMNANPPLTEDAVFHAQQAAEKAIRLFWFGNRPRLDFYHESDRQERKEPNRTTYTMRKMDFTPVFEQGENGWIVAQIKEWPAVISQGKTLSEAKRNLLDALYARNSIHEGQNFLLARDSGGGHGYS